MKRKSQTKTDPVLKAKFAKVRREYPHTKEIVYLNCAANSPFSTGIEKAISQYVARRKREGGDAHDFMHQISDELRSGFARITGAAQDEIGLSSSTTYGLNLAAFGLPLKRGDEVLLFEKEFPASVYAWRTAAKVRGLKVKFIKSTDSRFDISQFRRSISKRTKVLCLSWIQFFNGYKNDLKTIGEICRAHGIYFVVDAIQGMGVEPINLARLNIDLLTTGSQKWLLSAQGGGLFYVKRSLQERMIPSVASWMDVDWEGNYGNLFHFDKPVFQSARRFEMGYYNVLNIVSLLPPLKLFCELGLKQIQKHNYELIDRLAEYVENSDYYRITSSMAAKHRSSIFTFSCDNLAEVEKALAKNKIIVAEREGSIRVSVHCYNNLADIKRLLQVLDRHAGSR